MTSDDVTLLLSEVSSGKQGSWNKLLSIIYKELHHIAQDAMRKGKPGPTLQTTALVNEAYLRLANNKKKQWENRRHFFSVAARAMRQILVDKYRSVMTMKRGQGGRPVSLNDMEAPDLQLNGNQDLLRDLDAVDWALKKLGAHEEHMRKCTLVELRYFVGLTLKQSAEVLNISMATASRDWEFARIWLYKEMTGGR